MKHGNATDTDEDAYLRIPNRTWAIFLVSVLGLFLEMLFIRWIGTEVRIFAYLQNTILVACFLGLGLGCFTSRQKIDLHQALVPLLLLMLILAIPLSRTYFVGFSNSLSVLGDFVIWNNMEVSNLLTAIFLVIVGLVVTYLLLVLVVDIFVPIGRLLGRLMDDHPDTVWAYSVNVIGSLAGTWLFTLLSIFYQPPVTWFAISGILFLVFILWMRRAWRLSLGSLAAVVALSWLAGLVPGAQRVVWSPYQKLVLQDGVITVNNTGYQGIFDLSRAHTAADPLRFPPAQQGLSQYDIPLLLHPDPESYLIVGAGAGNDAAGGLRNGVADITAVEIDPAIVSIGRTFHPEQPYSSPNVHVVVNDARSFFATTQKKFDVIAFGLLDSHTTTSMTNARLDHYVYTRESIAQAKSLLAPGGIMVLTFESQKPFIADRMATVLKEAFDQDPLAFVIPHNAYGWGGVMFISGDLATARSQITQNARLDQFIAASQKAYPLALPHTTRIATDDWPYIYLQSPRIPVLFFLLIGLMALIFARSYKRWWASGSMRAWSRSHWHFFFLGAAFLLLEVQNISKASVVLGNTWQVNSVIVSGVLLMALLANWLARKLPRISLGLVYALLLVTCLGLYFVDLARFAFLPYALKAIVTGSLTSLPMLFSGIIFIRSFDLVEEKNRALGANLGGALVGALLQSITFVTGIRALLLIVAGLYFLSLLTRPAPLKEKRGLHQKAELAA